MALLKRLVIQLLRALCRKKVETASFIVPAYTGLGDFLLMKLEDRLGAQRIDLVVKPALDDPFARIISAEGVRL